MTQRLFLGNLAAVLLLPLAGTFAQSVDYAALNSTFGIPIWGDDNLWDDPDEKVAERLEWPAESRTSNDASYRLYPEAEQRVLGTRPFSLALYGNGGKASRLSMVFANKGDVEGADSPNARVSDEYKKRIIADDQTIAKALTQLLGPAKADKFGQGVKTREKVERWDWNGHTILLAAPRGEYVAVRIIPTSVADGEGTARVSDLELLGQLKSRVEHRPNGDVILKDIPMVDQGPKGYCVPATWERALRYMGISADMYVLAMAAQTKAGGGTTISGMMAGANEAVTKSGRRLVSSGGRITTQAVSRFIDDGMPVLWTMFVVRDLEKVISMRSMQRTSVTDWAAYLATLQQARKDARQIRTDIENGHVCMIIGYNTKTGEIAVSDSWGPRYAERWITVEEANAISQGSFTIIGR